MMFFALAAAACLAVAPQTDHVFARDLAPKIQAFQEAPPDAIISFGPDPGATRVFSVSELTRIGARLGIRAQPQEEICVTRTAAVLNKEDLLTAIRKIASDGQIEIVDFTREPAPEGELEFSPSGIHKVTDDVVQFRGVVRYASSKRFPIWVNAEISFLAPRVFAIGDLPAGIPIATGMVDVRVVKTLPLDAGILNDLSQVVGKIPRTPIRAGSTIRAAQLEDPKDVMRGDPIKVRITSGAAQLELDAVAESSGCVGARIQVRNPDSNKRFLALVDGKRHATVDASTGGVR